MFKILSLRGRVIQFWHSTQKGFLLSLVMLIIRLSARFLFHVMRGVSRVKKSKSFVSISSSNGYKISIINTNPKPIMNLFDKS